jgi:hypothetical protein
MPGSDLRPELESSCIWSIAGDCSPGAANVSLLPWV